MKTLKINITDQHYDFLKYRAIIEDLNVTDILNRAISLEKYFCENVKNGNKMLVENSGTLQEIVRNGVRL